MTSGLFQRPSVSTSDASNKSVWDWLYDWLRRSLTGAAAPVVEGRGYDSGTDSQKVSLIDPNIAWLFHDSGASDVTSGTIVSWLNAASAKKPRLSGFVLNVIAGVDDAHIELQENTGTLASPVWTRKVIYSVKASTSASFDEIGKWPDVPFGPPGDGATDAHVRLQIVAGTTPKCRAAFFGREA